MRKSLFLTILTLVLVTGVLALQHPRISHATVTQPDQLKIEIVSGQEAAAARVIVKYRDVKDRAARLSVAQSLDIDSDTELGGAGARLLHSRSRTTAELIAELSQRDDVLYAEPDYVAYGGATPNDSFFAAQQWGLHNTGQTISGQAGTAGADVSAPAAWDISTGDPNQVIAIFDSGIDVNHPDLSPNVWSAPGGFSVTLGGSTINCPANSRGLQHNHEHLRSAGRSQPRVKRLRHHRRSGKQRRRGDRD
jgi:subtilisin family serine protease